MRNASIERFETINKLNPEMPIFQSGSASVVFDSVTTGNMMGFDVWVNESGEEAALELRSNHGDLNLNLTQIGIEPEIVEAGGLDRRLSVQRLPHNNLSSSLYTSQSVSVAETGDTPLWICVSLEDGNQAWTSPIYLFRN